MIMIHTPGDCSPLYGFPVGDMKCIELDKCKVSITLQWSNMPANTNMTYCQGLNNCSSVNSKSGAGTDGPRQDSIACHGNTKNYTFGYGGANATGTANCTECEKD